MWGLILSPLGGFIWLISSIFLDNVFRLAGGFSDNVAIPFIAPAMSWFLILISGGLLVLSIPVGVGLELETWYSKRRRTKNITTNTSMNFQEADRPGNETG